ncbi:ABC transporter substrate-binding protein [Terrarubrum flagellatum]|uniref:ABC transporter substrate-binding protein n=1 Tax=Terrirubrum flagellatum TaxID=2895980 RepID=UPI003144DE32
MLKSSTKRAVETRGLRLITAALLSAAATLSASHATAQEQPIKIGGIVSVTGGGASIGKVAEIAWKLAVEDINAAGGVLGRKVQLVMADTQTDPTHAVAEMRRLAVNEKVDLVVGPATSQETIPVVAIANEYKLAQVSSAASTDLTPKFAPYHFSTSATGANQLLPSINYALDKKKYSKIALLSDNGGMSKAAISDVVALLKTKNIQPVGVQEFAFRTEDMTPQLFSLRNAKPDVILMTNSLGDDTRKMLSNRGDIGWDVPVMTNQTTANFAVGIATAIGKESFEGVYSVQYVGMTYCKGDAVGASPFAKFVKRAQAAVPDLQRLGGAAALTPYYIQPIILAAAIKGSGKTDGASIAAWIEQNSDKIENMVGPLAASKETHFLPGPETLKVVTRPYDVRSDGLLERGDCP